MKKHHFVIGATPEEFLRLKRELDGDVHLVCNRENLLSRIAKNCTMHIIKPASCEIMDEVYRLESRGAEIVTKKLDSKIK